MRKISDYKNFNESKKAESKKVESVHILKQCINETYIICGSNKNKVRVQSYFYVLKL